MVTWFKRHGSTRRMVPLLTAGLLATVAGIVGVGSGHTQQPGQLYYYYLGEKKLLTPSATELSVGVKGGETLPSLASIAPAVSGVEVDVAPLTTGVQRVTLRAAGAPVEPKGPVRIPRTLTIPAPGAPEPQLAMPDTSALRTQQAQQKQAVATAKPQALQSYRDNPSVKFAYEALVSDQTGGLLYPTDRIIVKARAGISEADLRGRLPPSLRVLNAMLSKDQYLLELTDPKASHPVTLAAQLQETAKDYVEWAEPDFVQVWQRSAAPNDTLYANQWHHRNNAGSTGIARADARTEEAWDTQTGISSGIVIAIVDDGIQTPAAATIFAHPDLTVANAKATQCGIVSGDLYGHDFSLAAPGDNDPNPLLSAPSHGTAVAGVAAATGANGVGVSGACQGCDVVAVRIFDDGGSTANSTIGDALTYAACVADVVNNSWGGGSPSSTITTAVQNAAAGTGSPLPKRTGGTPVLFATGNDASGYIGPINLPTVNGSTYRFEFRFVKDNIDSAGFDTAWIDNVTLPDSTLVDFEECTTLPSGWTTSGNANWSPVNQETRSSSALGGNCAVKAGAIGNIQSSSIVSPLVTSDGSDLLFYFWVSAEAASNPPALRTAGPCYDGLALLVSTNSGPFVATSLQACGTYSNQGRPLQDGVIAYPASIPQAIAVGAVTNWDRRSDYSQWGTDIDITAHSSGGSLGITTTDIEGTAGYSDGLVSTANGTDSSTDADYTNSFGGTSSATPLAAGIVALYLAANPTATLSQIVTALHGSTRPIGCAGYTSGYNYGYGYGVLDAEVLVTGTTSTVGDPANPCNGVADTSYVPGAGSGGGGGGSSSGGGGGSAATCMISYITQGWLPDHYLNPLRQVRGWLLTQGAWGRDAVRAYYRTSATLIRWLNAPHLGAVALGM